jgi:two-component system NtrC family sensor kinase
MSLKKKIALSFFISAAVIAVLAAFEYLNFSIIKKEIRFLELTDTIRSKSLQLRRHEKNYFLYSPAKAKEESASIHQYLDELDAILAGAGRMVKANDLLMLQGLVRDYRRGFDTIEGLLMSLTRDLRGIKSAHRAYLDFFPLIEGAMYERPSRAADFLESVLRLPPEQSLPRGLRTLDSEILQLRKNGEGIINVAKDLDRSAREKVETGIRVSQTAILLIFPLFLAVGMIMLFLITRNIVHRIGLLTEVVEQTGTGTFKHVAAPEYSWGSDEVGELIRKFDRMEALLEAREAEIERKNNELVHTKKLAAIGTLAAGVAHELNNPLNNIYLSTQVLVRELGDSGSATVKEVASDILGQTVRVKKIVGDLLEFARGREPRMRETELNRIISSAYARTAASAEMAVHFSLESEPDGVTITADPEQLEQVFINLFTNAVDAMGENGSLVVTVSPSPEVVTVRVADSGKGIPREQLDKVFEPFYTTKDKGTGLGLAIVFNIIKKHFGDITVKSEEGRGTTFSITLPRSV